MTPLKQDNDACFYVITPLALFPTGLDLNRVSSLLTFVSKNRCVCELYEICV